MIGFMCASEFLYNKENLKYKYDVIAETDGIIAVFPYGEIKTESRKFPHPVYYFKLVLIITDLSCSGTSSEEVLSSSSL